MVASAILSLNFPAIATLFDILDLIDMAGSFASTPYDPSRVSGSIVTAKDHTSATIADAINDAARKGQSFRSLGRDLQTFLRDGKPTRTLVPGTVAVANKGLRGKGSYPARRTARTELSASRSRLTLFGADAVGDLVKWETSPRHADSDGCDVHANADLFGFGAGVYPPRLAPRIPQHPFCLCRFRRVQASAEQRKRVAAMADHPSFDTFAERLWRPLGDPERARRFPDAYPNKLEDARREIIVSTEAVEGATRADSVAMMATMKEAEDAGLLADAYGAELVRGADGRIHATIIVDDLQVRHHTFDAVKVSDNIRVNFVAKRDLGWAANVSPNLSAKYGIHGVPVGLDEAAAERFGMLVRATDETGRYGLGDLPLTGGQLENLQIPGTSSPTHMRPNPITGEMEFTLERQALHDQIVRDALNGIPTSTEPRLFMLGGGPAAGKSTMLKSDSLIGAPEGGVTAVLVNPDEVKKLLPEYNAMMAVGDQNAANFVHEESSYVAKRITAAGIQRRQDILIDGVGVNLKVIKQVRPAGYKVTGYYAYVEPEEAVRRAVARGKKEGRFVPENHIRERHIAVSNVFDDAVAQMDEITLFDTSNGARPVANAVGGQLRVIDPDGMSFFRSIGERSVPEH